MTEDDGEDQPLGTALLNARSIQRTRVRIVRELLEAEEALRESRDHLTNILESITDGFVVLDRDWCITYLNPRAETIIRPVQKSSDALIGQSFWEVFPDLSGTAVEENYRRALREHMTVQLEFFYPSLDTWFDIRIYPTKDGLSIYFQDVGQRKRAENALRASEEFMRTIFDQTAVGIAVAGMDGRFQEMNDKFCTILGYCRAELQQMTLTQLTHPDDLDKTQQYVRRLIDGQLKDFALEKRYMRKDGVQVWSLTTVTLQKDPAGDPERLIGVIEDITQRKTEEIERARLSNVLDKSLNEISLLSR